MRVEMGRLSKEAAQGKVLQKQTTCGNVSEHGREDGIVEHNRNLFNSTEGYYREEMKPLPDEDTGAVHRDNDLTNHEEKEMKAIQVHPMIQHSGVKKEESKVTQDAHKGFKCWSEEIDFTASKFQEPDSRSKNTYVKLWADKESKRTDQTPKRIKLQIGSLSCANTLRFLEAENARVIREIREEHEKRLARATDATQLVDTRGKPCKELENNQELALYSVHEDEEGEALRSDNDRCTEAMEPTHSERGREREQKRVEDRVGGDKEKRRTEKDETVSHELRTLPMSGGKLKQRGEMDQRPVDENQAQPEAKGTTFGAEQDTIAAVFGGQVTGARQLTNATGKKRASIRPALETIKKQDRRGTEYPKESKGATPTLTFRPPSSSVFKNNIPCRGDKWAGRSEKHIPRPAEVHRGRAEQQGEAYAEERDLQKKALFHLEALRRIEEKYNNRINTERNYNFKTKRPNETPLRHPECWDNNFYSGAIKSHKKSLRKLQNKGQGGLNALLAPIFEEEIQRQSQNLDENSPTNSDTERQMLLFQNMKKAQLRAAEEQIAAVKARAQQRRAQLKTPMEKVTQGRVMVTNKKEKGRGGACSKLLKENSSRERLLTHTLRTNCNSLEQSEQRSRKGNEKARAEEELQTERHKCCKLKEEEQKPSFRSDRGCLELFGRLNRSDRIKKSGLSSQVNYRFRSSLGSSQKCNDTHTSKYLQFNTHTRTCGFQSFVDNSQKVNGSNRFEETQFSPSVTNGRFKSPLTSPRKARKTNALEHFANWEKELETAKRSRSRQKECSEERRVTIKDAPLEKSGLTSLSGSTSRFCADEHHGKSPRTNKSSESRLSDQAVPDHYYSVDDDCKCELKHKKEMQAKTRMKAIEENYIEIAKGARRRENCRSQSWLGKLYNTLTSFT